MPENRWQDFEHGHVRMALRDATDALLAEMGDHWTGRLSASALSTATAIAALMAVDPDKHSGTIAAGLVWLSENQNTDGGWGDTQVSKSNISTTALCWGAFGIAGADQRFPDTVAKAKAWLDGGGPEPLTQRIAARYGKDHTFSVPILMMLALSERIPWSEVPSLPFELAAVSHRFWGMLRLPVVSYALPALIAIGQVIHFNNPTLNPVTRLLRTMTKGRTLRVLESIQPDNGGFLEATPLTSFVTMSLAAMGLRENPVVLKGTQFLLKSVRTDGSWPIDTNLATWTTTLAIKALSYQPGAINPEDRHGLRNWLLAQQYRTVHPYTHAAPGGWAWTDLPGGVPDADDTPGALLALLRLGAVDGRTERAGWAGVSWLLGLQNRDGGIPTFCKGWGALPFDRSSPDLTAHTIRAWNAWRTMIPQGERPRLERGMKRALEFLKRVQRPDGSWLPLWFGNEHAPDDENPLYGTAQVVTALREVSEAGSQEALALAKSGMEWIAGAQNEDGGWGGVKGVPSTTEETGLAVEALAGSAHVTECDRGVLWLTERVRAGTWKEPAPIGFYFAKLWYSERLYPLIWAVAGLGKAVGK